MLFARIRSGRPEKEARAAPAVDVGAPEAPSPDQGPPTPEEATEDSALSAPRADGDEGLLQRRQAALTDIEAALTRKLKRTLQDEQNDLLDRLRGLKGEPTADQLLPEPADHVERYAGAAQPFVEQSAAAGVTFAAEMVAADATPYPGAPAVSDLSEEAAGTIVDSLRRRLEHALSAAAGDEQGVVMEALGAAYREWKSERIERIAGDVLAAAFAAGNVAGRPRRDSAALDRRRHRRALPRLRRRRPGRRPAQRRGVPDRSAVPARPSRLSLPPCACNGMSGAGTGEIFPLPAIRTPTPAH